MHGPDPLNPSPMPQAPGICFLHPAATSRANVEIGAYTYADTADGDVDAFFEQSVLYHFDFVGDRLVIGKFCAIARGVRSS